MNREQFLLLKLAEECTEVGQRAMKQIQFGRDEAQVGQPLTNGQRLRDEVIDLFSMVELLHESLEIPTWSEEEYIQSFLKKREKLQKYVDLSVKLGRLPEIKI